MNFSKQTFDFSEVDNEIKSATNFESVYVKISCQTSTPNIVSKCKINFSPRKLKHMPHFLSQSLLTNSVRKLCMSEFRCKTILVNTFQFLAKITKMLHSEAYECYNNFPKHKQNLIYLSIETACS